jgi:hypothetical protein
MEINGKELKLFARVFDGFGSRLMLAEGSLKEIEARAIDPL